MELNAVLAATDGAATASTGGGSGYFSWILIIGAAAAFWLMTRRSRKQQKAQQEFRNLLEPGDEVMTASGMIGTVVEIDDDAITLESTPGGGRTRWVRAAIAKKIEQPLLDDEEDDEPSDAADDEQDDAATEAERIARANDAVIDVPDDLSSLPPTRGDDEPDRK